MVLALVKKPLKNKLLVEKKELVDATKSETKAIVLPKNPVGRPREWTDEDCLEEARFLTEWCQLDTSIVLAQCYAIRGYSHELAATFGQRCKQYAEARQFAKACIGARREEMGLRGELDASIVKASMSNYDREYLETLQLMRTVMQLKAQGASGESVSVQVISFDSASDN